jgi:threonylcarbamoyladenosine tRNA methylthiotransferase MtaB
LSNTVAFYTLGCKLNFAETSTIGKQFLDKGYKIVEFNEHADVYVINTCTVTEGADKECRQIVRRALRNNPEGFVAVTGCYAQLRPDQISSIKGVDAVLGSNEKFKLFSLIDNFNKKELSCIHITPTDKLDDFITAFSSDADSRTRAFFKIQDGCDYKCSYCTIPLARGKSRSMQPDTMTDKFIELLKNDYKEIVLTGVNVGDYGKLINTNFYSALTKLVEVEGNFRLRISSIEPNLLTDEVLQLVKTNDKMCKHFHIPLQNGSPKILKLMKRRYTASFYKKLVNKVASEISDVGIGVDVIVGFPGETEEDFLLTFNLLKDLPISYLHVFTYSDRPNTKSIEMENKVPIEIKKERNNRLRILSQKKHHEFLEKMIGKNLEVLFEAEEHNGFIQGFASNYVRVALPYDSKLINKLANVKIIRVEDNICYAELINN